MAPLLLAVLVGGGVSALAIPLSRRRKRRLDHTVELIEGLRRHVMEPLHFRPLAPDEPERDARLGALATVTEELRAIGFVVLGDVTELVGHETPQTAGRSGGTALRAFARADGVVFGACSQHMVYLLSSCAGELHVTIRSRPGRQLLANPPFEHVQHFGPETPLAWLLEAHRAQFVAGSTSPTRVTSLEQFIEHGERAKAREIAWREAQDPDALLALDLRALLGERAYMRSGRRFFARLAVRREVATARVVSSNH